jgi:trehalose 6-phosphate synthase
MDNQLKGRLVVASNRLPVEIKGEGGRWQVQPVAGGLVTALTPIMARNHGLWFGWAGCGEEVPVEDLLASRGADYDYELKPVLLTNTEVEGYYRGFANEAIWPLFHDLLGHCHFDLENWKTYVGVNRRFAEAVENVLAPDDLIWVHDYQLMLVGEHLRSMGARQPLSFFLHIPFPTIDLFRRLPWKNEILRALLSFDQLGFQTLRDRRNFVNCVRGLIPAVEVTAGRRETMLRIAGRVITVGHFPISIDFDEFDKGARRIEVAEAAWFLRERLHSSRLILGIDRLDYTKGIPERFLAFERTLEKYPELQGGVALIQIVIPSRTHVPDYRNLKSLLDGLSGRINGRFTRHGWVPIHYMYRSLDRTQLLAHYRACEVALITPLRDGMNLVAKEYCAASIDGGGVLILSEFAGTADQLGRGALCVNPYDREGTADAIYEAINMEKRERAERMRMLRGEIRRNDVHRWLTWVLAHSGKAETSGEQHPIPPSGPSSRQIEQRS